MACLRRHLRAGGIIALPTEGVWGLSASPFSPLAARRLRMLKKRPRHKGFIVVGKRDDLLPLAAPLSISEKKMLFSLWPKKTAVLRASRRAPPWLRKKGQVALRESAHPLLQKLCCAMGPLISTSANISRRRPLRLLHEVRRLFGGRAWVLPSRLGGEKKPSAIVEVTSARVLRA